MQNDSGLLRVCDATGARFWLWFWFRCRDLAYLAHGHVQPVPAGANVEIKMAASSYRRMVIDDWHEARYMGAGQPDRV